MVNEIDKTSTLQSATPEKPPTIDELTRVEVDKDRGNIRGKVEANAEISDKPKPISIETARGVKIMLAETIHGGGTGRGQEIQPGATVKVYDAASGEEIRQGVLQLNSADVEGQQGVKKYSLSVGGLTLITSNRIARSGGIMARPSGAISLLER